MTYTLVATAKNEGPFLLEWVAYHRVIGFDNFILYQNDSDDYTDKILRTLKRMGVVKYFYNAAKRGAHQVRAYRRASRQESFRQADWVMALDLDEFLVINTGNGHLDDLIAGLDGADYAMINWRRFGNGGAVKISEELVTQRFFMTEHEDRITGQLTPFKTLFKPTQYTRCGIHKPHGALVPEDEIKTCNGSGLTGDAFELRGFRCTDPEKRKLAQINHYVVKDAASFVLKSYRGAAHQSDRNMGKHYWNKHNFNDQRDDSLIRLAPAIEAEMSALNEASDGRLMRLRWKAIELHQSRFETLMDQPGFSELYDYCASNPG